MTINGFAFVDKPGNLHFRQLVAWVASQQLPEHAMLATPLAAASGKRANPLPLTHQNVRLALQTPASIQERCGQHI
jgi:hypothetical protein